jgi:glutamate/tyrosine decarboxylase-like PLP-dependent enzyme
MELSMEVLSKSLRLDRESRRALWDTLFASIESYIDGVDQLPVSPTLNVTELRRFAQSFHFDVPLEPGAAFRDIASELTKSQVHTSHPKYFGLFNPAPTTMSIAADAFAAALNPQLAAWSHSPLAVEMEQHLIRSVAEKFGMPGQVDGVFTSGGAEANQTALLAALTHRWPTIASGGLRRLQDEPVFYISAEGHHSFLKAARTTGLGANSLRQIEVNEDLRLDVDRLREAIRRDRATGASPFMIVATAGTTGAGIVDPLRELALLAQEEDMWFHVDAAWGGAAVLVPALRSALDGIELADSITFDPHKWLSVSMGAGMFMTRHTDILSRLFTLQTDYMPKEGRGLSVVDPFIHSAQWSRRFIGLKLFLSLAVAGWNGYETTIRHQVRMGDYLRKRLVQENWKITNVTSLPVVCFTEGNANWSYEKHQEIADAVVASGEAWISTVQLGPEKRPALRACITNYETEELHVDSLLTVLHGLRQ